MDAPWSALLDDLQSNGLWNETLVVWMGEFGRTPQINSDNGRDHFPDVTPVVVFGGAIKGGVVVGQTNERFPSFTFSDSLSCHRRRIWQ